MQAFLSIMQRIIYVHDIATGKGDLIQQSLCQAISYLDLMCNILLTSSGEEAATTRILIEGRKETGQPAKLLV